MKNKIMTILVYLSLALFGVVLVTPIFTIGGNPVYLNEVEKSIIIITIIITLILQFKTFKFNIYIYYILIALNVFNYVYIISDLPNVLSINGILNDFIKLQIATFLLMPATIIYIISVINQNPKIKEPIQK